MYDTMLWRMGIGSRYDSCLPGRGGVETCFRARASAGAFCCVRWAWCRAGAGLPTMAASGSVSVKADDAEQREAREAPAVRRLRGLAWWRTLGRRRVRAWRPRACAEDLFTTDGSIRTSDCS